MFLKRGMLQAGINVGIQYSLKSISPDYRRFANRVIAESHKLVYQAYVSCYARDDVVIHQVHDILHFDMMYVYNNFISPFAEEYTQYVLGN